MAKNTKPIEYSQLNEFGDLYEPPQFTENDRNHFFSLNEAENDVLIQFRDAYKKVHFILLLGYFKAKPVTLGITWNKARDDIHYIYQRYFPKIPLTRKNLNKDSKSTIYTKILELTGFQRFSTEHELRLIEHATLSVSVKAVQKYVFDECVTFLNQQWIALPALSRIQRIVNKVLNDEEGRLIALFRQHTTGQLKSYIEELLVPEQTTDEFQTLRSQAKDYTYTELSRELNDWKKLEPLFKRASDLIEMANISDGSLKYYGELFLNYRTSQLKQFQHGKATIYIVAFICKRFRQINDNLTTGFYKFIKKFLQSAKLFGNDQMIKEASRLGKQVKKVSDVLYLLADNKFDSTIPVESLLKQVYSILPQADLVAVANYMADVELDQRQFIWNYYKDNEATIKQNLRRLFLTLGFEVDKSKVELAQQVIIAKLEIEKYGEIKTINASLIRPSDLPYLKYDNSEPTNDVDPYLFELYLYQRIFNAIDNDVCYINNTDEFRPLEDYLIDSNDKQHLIDALSLPILNVSSKSLVLAMQEQLEHKMKIAGKNISCGENKYVVFSDKTQKVKWSLSVKGESPKINNGLFEQFEQINIIELMRIINTETQFFNAFTHFQPKSQKAVANLDDILACILGNGTNFGLNKIASISDRSFNTLRTTQANYLRAETLKAANDAISNKTSKLPIFEFYQVDESGIHGSIDGQKFECRYTSLMARYSPKYFGQDKGVSAMTMVLNHVPANSKVISADEHESYHIFDLIHNNTTEIKPDTISTDTAGTNKYNFSILHFFGYRFAPRYKKFKDQFDRMFDITLDDSKEPVISLKKEINWELIDSEWDNICHLMLSLGHHKTSQSTLVKKLNRYKSNTSTLKALSEYDRAVKAQYILDYTDSETLRRHVQTVLNRGEAFHSLRRVIAETNGKKFRGTHPAELNLWNECARLIANCVIHYNAQILSRIKGISEREKKHNNLEALKRISPVAWYHVNFSGIYSFEETGNNHSFDDLAKNVRLDL